MPYSGPTFDKLVEEFIQTKQLKNYLDVGCGAGKYGKLIKSLIPSATVQGVEVSSNYISQFKLDTIYDQIFNLNIKDFLRNNLNFTTDLVIIGDCLEHLWKSDGLDMINFLVYRSKYILVIFPTELLQFDDDQEPSEHHISAWSEKDFENFEFEAYKGGCMNLIIINGYLLKMKTVESIEKEMLGQNPEIIKIS